jgi:hypothetical protein
MSDSVQWKDKVQDMLKVCQDEIVKTTEIGKKMLTASKANSELHETYEAIGEFVVKSLRNNDLEWDHPEMLKFLKKIEECEQSLENIESDVNDIKFSEEKK